MSSRTPQLRQSFLVTGAAVALVLVTGFAILSSRSAGRIVEQQANARGQDLATHVASLVDLYLRERRHEAEALAGSPAVVRAALDASQSAVRQRLPQLDIPTLERMFNQRRELGGDPDLAAYLRGYAEHSDFAELFFTESHGYNVLASDRTSDFVQSDEEWWQQAVKTGGYEGPPRYDSSAAVVSLEYDIAIRAPRVARPVGVLKAVFALDRLSRLLAAADLPGGVRLEVVDAQGRRIVTPDSAELLRPLPQAADIPRQSRPATARVVGPGGSADLVITVPTTNGKWWVVFREPERAAYAVARTTATNIVLWTVALFGAALTLLFVFWRRLNRRVTEPVKADGGRRGGRPALVRAFHGGGTAPAGGRHPHGGGRSGGHGHRDLGLDRADERVHRADVGHVPGPDQARRGAGAAGARGRGRRWQDPPDRDHPRGRRRRFGAAQQRGRRRREAAQRRAGPEHRPAREAGGRGGKGRGGGRRPGAGIRGHPEVRRPGQVGRHPDEHAGLERGHRGGACRAAGAWVRRRSGRGAQARLGGRRGGDRHGRHRARRAGAGAGDARSAGAARPGRRRGAGSGPDGGSGARDGGRGGGGQRRVEPRDRQHGGGNAAARRGDRSAPQLGGRGNREPARVGRRDRRVERTAERVDRGDRVVREPAGRGGGQAHRCGQVVPPPGR